MEGKLFRCGKKKRLEGKLETTADTPDGSPARTKPSMEAAAEPYASDSSAPPIGADGSASNPGAAAGARKRKAPAATARKPRKQQAQEPIQISVYYGRTEKFGCVKGDDLVDCSYLPQGGKDCAHVVGQLPLQPQSMSLVDLQLWIFKLFRLHPETQDLAIKGFLKQLTPDMCDEREPEWYMDYRPWETRHFLTDKCWSAFANKFKRRRNVMQKFMLYVESSEIKHYAVLLKATHDHYSQLPTVVFPGTKSLTTSYFRFLRLVEDLSMTPKQIMAYLAKHYGEQMSPPEAWRARQTALEREFGTFYDSHNFAPRLLKDITCKTPWGFVDIKDAEVAGCNNFRVLHRIFWAFGQCVQAFNHCRPVLCVKGTPLCGKYQEVLLTAVALDANGYSIPVAFAVVEAETKESWMWFLRNLEQAVRHPSDVCIIHDYKRELIDAIKDFLSSDQRQWQKVESRWCMEHLAENFFAYFGNKKLVMMFKKLCQQRRLNKFIKIWKELDELTTKYTADREGSTTGEMQQESVEHDEADLEAQSPSNRPDSVDSKEEGDHANENEGKIAKFSDWVRPKPMEKWSLVHDTKGARYGIMGADISDIYKKDPVLKGITCLPLSAIVEVTFLRLVEHFKNTSAAANEAIGNPSMNFPERVQGDMNSKMQKSKMHRVICLDTKTRNVFQGKEFRNFTVQSRQKKEVVHLKSESISKFGESTIHESATCSCNKPQLLHKPCTHVIAVCCQIGVSTAKYMSPYYSLAYLGRIWSGNFDEYKISRSYRNITPFECNTTTWIPDKRLERGLPVFVTSDCLETAADESEQQRNAGNGSTEDNQGAATRTEEPNEI
ncbi:uncharacterized protein LOC123429575 [Hordeum vulgare subsp. vulgare]|uniref:uncharacterized protein LOC123429575 n=1 Tax=Hordeum vulgare subsp. vulgare TaxID=112509 RepID=UPI0002969566|nr:uncharacterized protein LOC123429575 [Hordeum vulgare subsp. vulgare]